MKTFPSVFAGIFATFTLGWAGVVMIPQFQMGAMQPQVDPDTGDVSPWNIGGISDQGRRVYASEGCFYCHSQQIRSSFDGTDMERGWGTRRTVARDYIYDDPCFLGTMRNGPDLANIGQRSKVADWHYRHLYNPRSVTPESNMPSFRFLFETRKISGQRSADALELGGSDAAKPGFEIVPTAEAKALVGYLLSLDHGYPLKEAPLPPETKKAK